MNVVIIAGGPWQSFIVKYFKAKGHRICVVNPYVTETTALADVHINLDIRKIDEIAKSLESFHPDIITSDQCDLAQLPVANLAKRFGLAGNDIGVVEKFFDKMKMHAHACSQGILTPKTKSISCLKDLNDFIDEIGLTVILKPIDASAGCGFLKLSKEPTQEDLDYCFSHSFCGKIIAQQYVNGLEVTVDGFIADGVHKSLSYGVRGYFRDAVIAEVRYLNDIVVDQRVWDINDKYIESSGVNFGITHSEYILDQENDKIYFLESGLRGGGCGLSSHIVPWTSGYNLYDLLYKKLCGESLDISVLVPGNKRCGLVKFWEFSPGKVKKLVNQIQDARVKEFVFFVKEGDEIKIAINGKERHAVSVILGESGDDLILGEQDVAQNVCIEI